MKKPVKLDRINRNILMALQDNARISNIELADKVSLSPSACLQRTKALEDAGYILKYVMAADLEKICIHIMGYLEITLNSHRMPDHDQFEKAVRLRPEFVDCLRINGETDYIAFVVCSTIAALNSLCDDLLTQGLPIARIVSKIVLDKPKWFAGYPMDRLEWKS